MKKSRIELAQELWEALEQFVGPARRAANLRYREGHRAKVKAKSNTAHDISNKAISDREDEVSGDIKVDDVDGNKGAATITNQHGTARVKITVKRPERPEQVFVEPVDSLPDGILFRPAMITDDDKKSHIAVQINQQHPYYDRVYVPNLARGVLVQGMDSLLWSMAAAEMNAVGDDTVKLLEEIRYDMSRRLRKLVESLPEPVLDEAAD